MQRWVVGMQSANDLQCLCSAGSGDGDQALVKGYQLASMGSGERQKIGVGHL
jgi:hypothetical protein